MLRLASLVCLLFTLSESINALDFTLVNGRAPWSARENAFLTRSSTSFTYQSLTGQSMTAPANSFLMFGSGDWAANDVWLSRDKGSTWSLIAGNGTAFQTFWPSKGVASLTTPAGRHFRLSGERTAGGSCDSSIWQSTNGQSWTSQETTSWSPRMWANALSDSTGAIYIMGGRSCAAGQGSLFDVWRSTNQGSTWTRQTNQLPFGGPRNSVAGHVYSDSLRKDILYHYSGWNGNADFNDIWTSSDQGVSWQSITREAPWRKRDDAVGFVTSNGVLVLVGGKSVAQPDIYHNDIWVSLDGGYSWGKCIEDAAFSDRRYLAATMDEAGYLYVAAGESNEPGSRLLNDVWKSTISFTNTPDLVRECGVKMPVCGRTGLSCYPGQAGTNVLPNNGGVTCPACGSGNADGLNFLLQTTNAPWSARAYANMESFPVAVTYTPVGSNSPVTARKGSLIMQGSGKHDENDVWLSTDRGVNWALISGISRYGRGGFARATAPYDQQSFSFNPFAVAYAFDERFHYMYRIGGEITTGGNSGQCANVIIASTDGLRWNQANPTAKDAFTPLRKYAAATVDSTGYVYVTGGQECGKSALNDVWKSADRGRSWNRQTAKAPWAARLVHVMLQAKSTSVLKQQDVMWVVGGWSGSLDFNDVWASTDGGINWHMLTLGANWQRRDDFNAEATKSGLLVVSGGKQANSDGSDREFFNDVWVSADGGYTWGECIKDAAFADRRYQMTVFDDDGHLLVSGGQLVDRGSEQLFNDVWRSSFSFNDLSKVTKACNIEVHPKCGAGLSCLPNSPGFRRLPGSCGVTCTACPKTCSTGAFDFVRLSGSAPWSARSGGNMEQINKAITYVEVDGQSVTAPAGAIIMHGESNREENDVWISRDQGLTWRLIAGISRKGRSGVIRAGGGHDVTSFRATVAPAYTLDSKYNVYRINGENVTDQACADEVWMSTNGGVTWMNQYLDRTSTKHITPTRQFAGAIWDTNGNIFVSGGRECTSYAGRNDVWRSSDQGRNWQLMTAKAAWPARLVHQMVSIPAKSTRIGKDLLVIMSGWIGDEGKDLNDVWASSDSGKSWYQITANAAWSTRDDANAEVTEKGLLVLTSGKTESPYEIHNDVYVSADGGYTWGQCTRDAAFSDRRYQMTLFDNEDYLYVSGGDSVDGSALNDVWRSTLPFSDAQVLISMCNVKIPSCGIGLHCWPNSKGFKILSENRGATCDLCQNKPEPEPEDDDSSSSSSSTGRAQGIIEGAISTQTLLIIFAVVAVAVVAMLLFARSWRNKQIQAQQELKNQTEMSTNLLRAQV